MSRYNILFIHGIVGNCKIFNFLLPHIPDGYNLRFLTLDGHGGDALYFSKASMSRWRRQVAQTVYELQADGPLLIVAHSMGCLLALEQAALGKADRLFLLNPPMLINLSLRMMMNALKVATGQYKNDPIAEAAKDAYGISLDFNPLHYYGWPARYLELFAYISTIRKVTPKIMPPSYTILSTRDEMVSPRSAKWITAYPQFNTVILPQSRHYYYDDSDKPTIIRCFIDFLGRSSIIESTE